MRTILFLVLFNLTVLSGLGKITVYADDRSGGTESGDTDSKKPFLPQINTSRSRLLSPILEHSATDSTYGQYGFVILNREADRIITDDVYLEKTKFDKIEPIPFRDEIANELLDILANKGTAILLGDKGAGKEAIVERLAQLIIEGKVPNRPIFDHIRNADIIKVIPTDLYRIQTTPGKKGIDAYLALLNAARDAFRRDIILFIDQAHAMSPEEFKMLGAYSESERHQVQIILSAVPEELKKMNIANPKLLRPFIPVAVDDLTPEQVTEIMGKRWLFELDEKYGVRINAKALSLATRFGKKVYPTLSTFDSAYRLLSEAAVHLNHKNSDVQGLLKLDEAALMDFLRKKIGATVDPTNPAALAQYEKDFKDRLNSRVLGQKEMVNSIVETWIDLQDPTNERGVRSLVLIGPTGVGKTLLANEFAKEAFGSTSAVLEIACSEYTKPESSDALFGAPLNYKGSDVTAGIVNDWLSAKGKNGGILILNEIEKASPELLTILMEMLEKARSPSKDGIERKLVRHLIVFTSNRGANLLFPAGYEKWSPAELENHLAAVTQARLKELFQQKTSGKDEFKATPEFLARIDRFGLARPITREVAFEILRATATRFSEANGPQNDLKLVIDDSLIEYLLKAKFKAKEGVRVVERSLEFELKRALNQARLDLKPASGAKISIRVYQNEDDKSVLEISSGKKKRTTLLETTYSNRLEDPEFVERMKQLDTKMKSMVIGQDHVIDTVKKAVVGFYGRDNGIRPLSFFLVGTTGGGKTEMGRALSYALFDRADRVEVLNFGNIKNEADMNNMFGSQSGYSGMDEIRKFETALMRNPNGGVLVFDELSNMGGKDKDMKNELFKQLYEIFEEGRWYSVQTNTTYDLSKFVIIGTGNDGEELFQGVEADDIRMSIWQREKHPERVRKTLRDAGVPEAFLGRLAGLFMMKPLLTEESQSISKKLLKSPFDEFQKKNGIEISFDQEFLRQFTKSFFTQSTGARNLRTVIEDRMLGVIDLMIVNSIGFKAARGKKINIRLTDNLSRRPFVKTLKVPERKVTLELDLVDHNGSIISSHADDLTYDAPIILKSLLDQALGTAWHEAGHAVVNNPDLTSEKVEFITINGQGEYLGYARYDDVNKGVFKGSMTEEAMLAWVARLYAGQRAQILAGHPRDTGWNSDRQKANDMITRFLVDNGMHPQLAGMERVDKKYIPSKSQQKIIDKEIDRLTETAIKMADKILIENWHLIRNVVAQIIRTGSISMIQFDKILEEKKFSDQKWKLEPGSEKVVKVVKDKKQRSAPSTPVPNKSTAVKGVDCEGLFL